MIRRPQSRITSGIAADLSGDYEGNFGLAGACREPDALQGLAELADVRAVERGAGSDQEPLTLVDSQTFSTGVLYLTYEPARTQGA